jgi:hypothetical protein
MQASGLDSWLKNSIQPPPELKPLGKRKSFVAALEAPLLHGREGVRGCD